MMSAIISPGNLYFVKQKADDNDAMSNSQGLIQQ